MTPATFRAHIWRHYRKHGRGDLPWRKTKGIYQILVSEVMLQQTQVERVIPFYKKFIQKFGTAQKLAAATLSDVLKSWQGLGYNRRAKMLHAAARELATRTVSTISELETLPGVGPYTARAVAAFAWNQDAIVIETNIRTVIIHHFFPKKKKVSDKEIAEILQDVLPKGKAREWYSALMDYGASLKRAGTSYNTQSKKYTKQPKFTGSLREVRGAILRSLSEKNTSRAALIQTLGASRIEQARTALAALLAEGLVSKKGSTYTLAD